MSNSNKGGNSGLGVCSVVGIVFVILKLVGVINWSWIWVLCPFWIGIAGWIILFVIVVVAHIINEQSFRRGSK